MSRNKFSNVSKNINSNISNDKNVNFITNVLRTYTLTILSIIANVLILLLTVDVFDKSKLTQSYSLKNTVYLYLSLYSIGIVFISLLKSKLRRIFFINWTLVIIIISAFEIFLKRTNYDNILNYSEVNGYGFNTDYFSYKNALNKRSNGVYLYQHSVGDSEYVDDKLEFKFKYTLDPLGNNNTKSCGDTNAINKIITIGDSFTFGIGAKQSRSWPNQLDSILKINSFSSSICNVATSGSDPIYMFNAYRDFYIRTFQGDIILVNINSSDAKDIVVRGGIDRYQQPYTKGDESWLPLYASSLIYRMYMQKVKNIEPYLLVEREQVDELYLNAFDNIFEIMIQYNQYVSLLGKKVVFIFNPGYHEVLSNELLFGPMVDEARNFNFYVIDLLPAYRKAFLSTGNVFDFFWEKDFHNNEIGYRIWAEEVYRYLYENQFLKSSQ